jgi:perosamine synthetase
VTNSDEIAAAVQSEEQNFAVPTSTHWWRLLLEMVSYSLLLNPQLFWIPNSLPFLRLGTTEFDPSFRIDPMNSLLLGLLNSLLEGLDDTNEIRRTNAKAITDALSSNAGLAFPRPDGNSRATFVRLPVLAHDHALRDRAVDRLRKAGIGASAFYPSAICDIPTIEKHMSVPNFHRTHAEDLSQRLFTLPVHPFVKTHDIERMAEILTAL